MVTRIPNGASSSAIAGVVHQQVEPAEPDQCRVDDFSGAALIGHVVGEGQQPLVLAKVEPRRVAGGGHHRVAFGQCLPDQFPAAPAPDRGRGPPR